MSLKCLLSLSTLLALTGCKHADYPYLDTTCPRTALVEDLKGQMIRGEETGNPQARLKIEALQSHCSKSKKVGDVTLRLIFSGLRFEGPERVPFQYFVAVITDHGEILDKKIYSAFLSLPSLGKKAVSEELISFTVPDALLKEGKNYRLLVGFQKKHHDF